MKKKYTSLVRFYFQTKTKSCYHNYITFFFPRSLSDLYLRPWWIWQFQGAFRPRPILFFLFSSRTSDSSSVLGGKKLDIMNPYIVAASDIKWWPSSKMATFCATPIRLPNWKKKSLFCTFIVRRLLTFPIGYQSPGTEQQQLIVCHFSHTIRVVSFYWFKSC